MILNQAQILFDIADEEAKKLQKSKGLPEMGIDSTQVQGLIVALGTMLDKLVDVAEQKAKAKTPLERQAEKEFYAGVADDNRRRREENKG